MAPTCRLHTVCSCDSLLSRRPAQVVPQRASRSLSYVGNEVAAGILCNKLCSASKALGTAVMQRCDDDSVASRNEQVQPQSRQLKAMMHS
jgi:hypothetical protein